MTKSMLRVLGLLVALVGADVCTAQSPPTDEEVTPINRIQSNLRPAHYLKSDVQPQSISRVMLEEGIPGVGMAFVEDGHVAWVQSYGYARLDQVQEVTEATVFAAASLSKPVTAMAALKLVDQGRLRLDEDVNAYLKGWQVPNTELTLTEKVTLRRLIGHIAGVENHLWSAYAPDAVVPTLEQMLAGKAPSIDPPVTLFAVPGEREKYSNPGYTIIRKLIADQSEQGFDQAMQALVLTPAGMVDSSFVQPIPQRLKARAATGYSRELAPYPYQLFPFKAAGGLWTTPTDLGRFIAVLLNDYHQRHGRLISPELAAQVFAPSPGRLGFSKKLNATDDDLVFEHWGSNSGFTSYMVGALKQRQGLVVMTNSDNGFGLMAMIAQAVADEYNWPVLQSTGYESVELPADQLERYSGRFQGGNEAMRFTVQDGVLSISGATAETKSDDTPEGDAATAASDAKTALVPVGESLFILPATNTTYEFLTNREGNIQWVRVTKGDGSNNDYAKAQQ